MQVISGTDWVAIGFIYIHEEWNLSPYLFHASI